MTVRILTSLTRIQAADGVSIQTAAGVCAIHRLIESRNASSSWPASFAHTVVGAPTHDTRAKTIVVKLSQAPNATKTVKLRENWDAFPTGLGKQRPSVVYAQSLAPTATL